MQDGGVIYFPSTIDESDSMTSEAPISKPDVPATLGQGKNVDPLPSPTEPDIPPELRDLMDKRAAQENLIKAAEAEIAFNIKVANLNNYNFYKTLKEKLLWGKDKRN